MVKSLRWVVAGVLIGAAAPGLAQGLPGGATSLRETHGDWVVGCALVESRPRCSLSQAQLSQQNNQRLLAIELAPAADGRIAGTLMLPFGLQLDSGVLPELEGGPALAALRFSTCLPAGCAVPLLFDATLIAALRRGAALKLTAAASDSGQPVAFTISLAGFSGALDRVTALQPN